MDNQAMEQIQYGLYVLGTGAGNRKNGCIINACMQAAMQPTCIAISVLNKNYSCELIKESGLFTLSILDTSVSYEIIRHFGMQSGRDTDKLEGLKLPEDANGIPYLSQTACAMLSCRVINSQQFDSHTLFTAEVTDAKQLSSENAVTYAEYHSRIKPKQTKSADDKEICGWRCKICGYIYESGELPPDYICPLCGHGAEDFEPIYKN